MQWKYYTFWDEFTVDLQQIEPAGGAARRNRKICSELVAKNKSCSNTTEVKINSTYSYDSNIRMDFAKKKIQNSWHQLFMSQPKTSDTNSVCGVLTVSLFFYN